jgi:hypothetical protein
MYLFCTVVWSLDTSGSSLLSVMWNWDEGEKSLKAIEPFRK